MWSAIIFILSFSFVSTVGGSALDVADRIRIGEAHRIVDQLGDDLWPGLSEAPFAVLLVTPETEFLVHHPNPTSDFTRIEFDSLLDCDVYSRPRVFDKNLLATYPAVAGVPTVVIGQPRHTAASHTTRWVVTLLHEHFHQYQQSQADYYESVDALGLAGGDKTGMWMLEYPFPYDSKEVNELCSEMCRRLWEAVGAINGASFRDRLDAYLDARRRFKRVLTKKDFAYFSFQVWQEGIARYTEYQLAQRAGFVYTPTQEFLRLPDYVPFEEDAVQTREHFSSELLRASLKRERRTVFYHIGAAEGLLLDRANPGWRRYYLTHMFFTDTYFEMGADSR